MQRFGARTRGRGKQGPPEDSPRRSPSGETHRSRSGEQAEALPTGAPARAEVAPGEEASPQDAHPAARPGTPAGIRARDLAAWSVDGFLAGQPQLAGFSQDRLGLRDRISEFLRGSVSEGGSAHAGSAGADEGAARLEALAYTCHVAIALRDRNLLNQDDQNQLRLAKMILEQLCAAAPFLEPRLRRKVLAFCASQCPPDTYMFMGVADHLVPVFAETVEFASVICQLIERQDQDQGLFQLLEPPMRELMSRVCRDAIMETVAETHRAAIAHVPADCFTYSCVSPILRRLESLRDYDFRIESDVEAMRAIGEVVDRALETALFEEHAYLSYQVIRWTRALPQFYTAGTPETLNHLQGMVAQLRTLPPAATLEAIRNRLATTLSAVLPFQDQEKSQMLQAKLADILADYTPFEGLHSALRHLDATAYMLNSMSGFAQSLVTKDISLREETRLNTFLASTYQVRRSIEMGQEQRTAAELLPLIAEFLGLALPATARGTSSWQRLLEGFRKIGMDAFLRAEPSRWDAVLDGVKYTRRLERHDVLMGAPSETMDYFALRGGVLADPDVRSLVESSAIQRHYDTFFGEHVLRVSQALDSIKMVLVKNLDASLERPRGGAPREAMKDLLDIQRPLGTVQMFLLSLGNLQVDQLMAGEAGGLRPLSPDSVPAVGEHDYAERLPARLAERRLFVEKLLPYTMRLYPLEPPEAQDLVKTSVRTIAQEDVLVFSEEPLRVRLAEHLTQILVSSADANRKMFTSEYREAMGFLKRVPREVNPDIHAFFGEIIYPRLLDAYVRLCSRDAVERRARQPGRAGRGVTQALIESYRMRAETAVQECLVLHNGIVTVLDYGESCGVAEDDTADAAQPSAHAPQELDPLEALVNTRIEPNPFSEES
ncbi:MAG: hypothetical protein AB1714_12460 [Acidobacteriota bacterium]